MDERPLGNGLGDWAGDDWSLKAQNGRRSLATQLERRRRERRCGLSIRCEYHRYQSANHLGSDS